MESTQTRSETAESEQDSKPARIDVSAIAEKFPVNQREAVLDLSTFSASKLTLIDVLDMADKADVEPENLAGLLDLGKNSPRKARMLVSLVWVLCRRAEPDLTYEEVATWKITVIGKLNDAMQRKQSQRDRAIVSAAEQAGVSPAEAGALTVGQLSALNSRNQRRAAARRGRRR